MSQLVLQLAVLLPEVEAHRERGERVADQDRQPRVAPQRRRALEQGDHAVDAHFHHREQDGEANEDRRLVAGERHDDRRRQPDEHERREVEHRVDEHERHGPLIGRDRPEGAQQPLTERGRREEGVAGHHVDDAEPHCDHERADQPGHDPFAQQRVRHIGEFMIFIADPLGVAPPRQDAQQPEHEEWHPQAALPAHVLRRGRGDHQEGETPGADSSDGRKEQADGAHHLEEADDESQPRGESLHRGGLEPDRRRAEHLG